MARFELKVKGAGDALIPVTWNGVGKPCITCRKLIGFGFTENKKWLPFDISLDDPKTPHWATCTKPENFRKDGHGKV